MAVQVPFDGGLIGDLLDAGRIGSDTLSVAPEPSELAALVEEARSTFLGAGGAHAVRVDLPSCLPPVMAARQRILQVLNNWVLDVESSTSATRATRKPFPTGC